MKKLLVSILILAVLVILGLWGLYANLDTIVKKVMEDVGSQVTGTPVSVSEVQLELAHGKAAVGSLAVSNPAGFSQPDIFTLGGIAVNINVSSLDAQPIIIDQITVDEPEVFYELGADGKSNLDVLKSNLRAGPDSGSAGQAGGDGAGQSMKMIIRKLIFTGGSLNASSAVTGDKPVSIELPGFSMMGLGAATGGATASQISREVFTELIERSARAVASAGADQLKDELRDQGREALDEQVGDALKGVFGN